MGLKLSLCGGKIFISLQGDNFMLLYHGSENIIDKPVYGKGKLYNDFGRGFYCTENLDLAREWSVDEDRDGYANSYEIDTSKLAIMDLNSKDYCVLHWITLLIQNRHFELSTPLAKEGYNYLTENFSIDIGKYDAIKGYRADDSYFSYAQDFVNGLISVSQLSKALHLGNLGEQIVLKSRKAFGTIKFLRSENVASSEWYTRKMDRERVARKEYYAMNKDKYIKGDLYMPRIIDEEVTDDDPRLR